jgi:hypothetical protein
MISKSTAASSTHYDRAESMYRLGYPPAVLAPTETAADGSTAVANHLLDRPRRRPQERYAGGQAHRRLQRVGVLRPEDGLERSDGSCGTFDRENQRCSLASRAWTTGRTGQRRDASCPAFLGVEDGDTEEQLKDKLGKFNQQRYDGALKTVRYDALGVDFVLRRGRIYVLRTNREKGNVPIIFWRFVLTLLAPL